MLYSINVLLVNSCLIDTRMCAMHFRANKWKNQISSLIHIWNWAQQCRELINNWSLNHIWIWARHFRCTSNLIEVWTFGFASGLSMISFQVSFKSEILAAFTDIVFEILFKSYFDVKVLKICSSLNTPWNQNNNKAAGGPNWVTSAQVLALMWKNSVYKSRCLTLTFYNSWFKIALKIDWSNKRYAQFV